MTSAIYSGFRYFFGQFPNYFVQIKSKHLINSICCPYNAEIWAICQGYNWSFLTVLLYYVIVDKSTGFARCWESKFMCILFNVQYIEHYSIGKFLSL